MKTPSPAKLSRLNLPVLLLLIAALGLAISTVVFYQDAAMYRDRNKAQTDMMLTQQATRSRGASGMQQTIAVAAEDAVYFPQIHLKLPLSEQAAQLVYSSRNPGEENEVVDVSTASFEALVPTRSYRLGCNPVRIAFEDKANPYNPHEHPQQPVRLKDGRILQVYSFSEDDCTSRWQLTGVDSAKIAELFQKAESY